MKFCCIICSEDIEASATVSATTCGHLFHHDCLFQWFQRHISCPQCRKSLRLNKDVIKKLYFEPGPDSQSDVEDAEALKNKISQLEAELSQNISDSYRHIVELSESVVKTKNLKSKLKKAEQTSRTLQETLDSTRVQLKLLSKESGQLNESKRQITRLKAKLNAYETTLNQTNVENHQLKVRIVNLASESKRMKRDHQKELENMSKKSSKVINIRPSATVSTSISPNVFGVVRAKTANGYKMEMNGKGNERRSNLRTSKAAACLGLKEHRSGSPANRPPLSPSPVYSVEHRNIKKRRRTENEGQRTSSMHGEMGGHNKPHTFPTGKRLR